MYACGGGLRRGAEGGREDNQGLFPVTKELVVNRREFLAGSAALAGGAMGRGAPTPVTDAAVPRSATGVRAGIGAKLDLNRHRFGVNYTPSHNWWFCWNDWDAAPIARDLDAIVALGADHLRILLIWPYFQPNPAWVSPLHLERLDALLGMMGTRGLDALITVFTGQLSGWLFLPPFQRKPEDFFTDATMGDAQARFVRELAHVAQGHENVIGFDLGNEINTCWTAPLAVGDAWMERTLAEMEAALPGHLNVNGVDHQPWFRKTTFSARALAAQRMPVMHCYPWWTGALRYGGAMDPPSVDLLAGMAALIRAYAGDAEKPVWAGEFNTCIEALDEKQQAAWLEKAVLAAIAEGVSWFSYWDSHDVDRKFAFNSVEYGLGLMTNDGRVKDAGRTFQQLAAAYRGKTVTMPQRNVPAPPAEPTMETTWAWLLEWMGWKERG